MAIENRVTYPLDEAVDFVVIGSGSAGGILGHGKELRGLVFADPGILIGFAQVRELQRARKSVGNACLEPGEHAANTRQHIRELRTQYIVHKIDDTGFASSRICCRRRNSWRKSPSM